MAKIDYVNLVCDKFILKEIRTWLKSRNFGKVKSFMNLEDVAFLFLELLFSIEFPVFRYKILIQKSLNKSSTYNCSVPSIERFFSFSLKEDGFIVIKIDNEEKKYFIDETNCLSFCGKKVEFPSYSVDETFLNGSYRSEMVCKEIGKINLAISYKTNDCIAKAKIEGIVSTFLHSVGDSSQPRLSIDMFWSLLNARLGSQLKENILKMRISFSKSSKETDSLKWVETDYIELDPDSTTFMITKPGEKMTITNPKHWEYKGVTPETSVNITAVPGKDGGICIMASSKVKDADVERFNSEISCIKEKIKEEIELTLSLPKL